MRYLLVILLQGLRNQVAPRIPAYAPVYSSRFKPRWRG